MTETSLLQGEVNENPGTQDLEVEKLLLGMIRALANERTQNRDDAGHVAPAPPAKTTVLSSDWDGTTFASPSPEQRKIAWLAAGADNVCEIKERV